MTRKGPKPPCRWPCLRWRCARCTCGCPDPQQQQQQHFGYLLVIASVAVVWVCCSPCRWWHAISCIRVPRTNPAPINPGPYKRNTPQDRMKDLDLPRFERPKTALKYSGAAMTKLPSSTTNGCTGEQADGCLGASSLLAARAGQTYGHEVCVRVYVCIHPPTAL